MSMPKQAKYLIDDAKFHIAGIATSWDYDNRVDSNLTDPFPGVLVDRASGYGVRVKRDFQPQCAGRLTLEFLYNAEPCGDGACLCMQSSNGKTLFELTADGGKFFLNGEETGITAKAGLTRGRITLDLDRRAVSLFLGGGHAACDILSSCNDAARLVLGATGKTEIRLTPMKIRLTADFLVHESFLCTDSAFPPDWQLDGSFEIRSHTAANPQMDYTYAAVTAAAGSRHTAFLPFAEPADGDIACEGYFLLPEGADGAAFSITAGGRDIFGVQTRDKAFYTMDGAFLRRFTPNVWQVLRLETEGARITVKIDGKQCGSFTLNSPAAPDGLRVVFAPKSDAVLYFADLICENHIDYPDYCPEPKAVRHPDYEVGVNVCNMWREGHHFGWDRITYFTDNTPLIGPYDEGSPEVADWEIKFMTEHGITFQHFCWYCPDPLINFPIKRSRMDSALRDGFMNAKYSDKMKFIIMWENNTYRNTNPEDFKNYVWKYWCEYFFTDPRYLKIGNKPLLSLWSFAFVSHWGGEEKAKEIIAFMNEDIKNYGCDGIVLMATASSPDANRYRQLSEYCDITYAYHFGKDGCYSAHQLESIDALNALHDNEGLAPFMQTASVGFNSCPWHGADARSPLIELDDYEKVLRHIKRHGDESDGEWYNKIFMMSTWNEYGEGTYIMPSGIHGFGYLDAIRKVFVPESGACENLLPDENQQKRITTLRVPGRTVIRRLGFTPSEESKTPNTTVKVFDFSKPETFTHWRGYNDAVSVSQTGAALELCPVGHHEHYSLSSAGGAPFCLAKEGSHLRLRIRSREGNSRIRVAFLTDGDKRWASNKCTATVRLPAAEEFCEMYFDFGKFQTWTGMVTDIRIDNMARLPLEIEEIALMTYEEPVGGDPAVYVNGEKLRFAFEPRLTADGSMIVSLDPGYCGFRAFALYHEYNRAKKQLYAASQTVEAFFTEGSGEALVNGEKRRLRHPLTMRDGLPTLALDELCEIFGISLCLEGKHWCIQI